MTKSDVRLSLDVLYGLASLIGCGASIATLVLVKLNIKSDCQGVERAILYSLVCITIALAFSMTLITLISLFKERNFQIAEVKKFNAVQDYMIATDNLSSISANVHNIIHYERDDRRDILALLAKGSISPAEMRKKIDESLVFLITLTQSLKSFADKKTNSNCAVTLKIRSPDGQNVRTLFRDHLSKRRRSGTDVNPDGKRASFKISENKDFCDLIHLKRDTNRYFVSNNLHYDMGGDWNSNKDWEISYNSAVVCPIECKTDATFDIIGFLCIDSLAADFKDQVLIDYVAGVSDLLYGWIVAFEKLCTVYAENYALPDHFLPKAMKEWS